MDIEIKVRDIGKINNGRHRQQIYQTESLIHKYL